jgi:hypothetical protein
MCQSLSSDGISCSFPALRGVSLAENAIAEADIAAVHQTILAMHARRLPKKKACLPSQQIVVFDGPCMRAAAIACCLHKSSSSHEFTMLGSEFDIFCASSFSAVIAVATAMKLPAELIFNFFREVCKSVFSTTPYLTLANQAGRVIRDWWTGGNFYSAAAFRTALVQLFTESTLKIRFETLTSLIGKKIILFAAHQETASSAHVKPVVFRSYAEETVSGTPSTATVEDVLKACCATPTFFAASSIAGNNCVDHLHVPMTALLSDLLTTLKLDAKAAITVFTTAGEDSFLAASNPLVPLALASCISIAPKRGSYGVAPSALVTSLRQKVELGNVARMTCAGVSLSVRQVAAVGKIFDDIPLDLGDPQVLQVGIPNKVRQIDFSFLQSDGKMRGNE